MLVGNKKWERTLGGQTEKLLSEQELVEELTSRHGYSRDVVDLWIAAGGLAAAMKQPEPQEAPPLARVAPSKRTS
ncbi:MAG TPA: hypothetical protein VHE55_04280 [Fimbriimonadaceae bacterium]|nr:hypothetical protein [Fimbriimonadaceae bacterium]